MFTSFHCIYFLHFYSLMYIYYNIIFPIFLYYTDTLQTFHHTLNVLWTVCYTRLHIPGPHNFLNFDVFSLLPLLYSPLYIILLLNFVIISVFYSQVSPQKTYHSQYNFHAPHSQLTSEDRLLSWWGGVMPAP